MKYLYKILRLFKCPHKYIKIDKYKTTHTYMSGKEIEVVEYHLQCKYCGKIKSYIA